MNEIVQRMLTTFFNNNFIEKEPTRQRQWLRDKTETGKNTSQVNAPIVIKPVFGLEMTREMSPFVFDATQLRRCFHYCSGFCSVDCVTLSSS